MNFLRQLVSYVLLAGMAIPTFSSAMNPLNMAHNAMEGLQNGFNDTVDVQFRLGLKPSHINEEVHAIKRLDTKKLDPLVYQGIVTELRTNNFEFQALSARAEAIRARREAITLELGIPNITIAQRERLELELANLGVELNQNSLIIDLYIKMHQLYGFKPLDVNGRIAVNNGQFAINTTIINNICGTMRIPVNDVLFFSTHRSLPNHRDYGVIKGFIYPVHSGLNRKVVLINVDEFNRLNPSQRQDRLAHVLAEFKEQEAQWRILRKENRARMLSLAKKLPYIIAACGLVYYWTHGRVDSLPCTTLTDVYAHTSHAYGHLATAGNWAYGSMAAAGNTLMSYMPSFLGSSAPVNNIGYFRAAAQAASNGVDGFCDSVIWLLTKMRIMAPPAPSVASVYWEPVREFIQFVYADLVTRTPYEVKTIGSAVAGSWMIDTLLTQWNKLYNILDSYRTDKIVCQDRGEAGLAGIYERCAHDIAQNHGGMTRIWYLWLQKKLRRI